MANFINNNPWKGLNFYVEGEVLYGRNNEIESLSQFIINNTQTVLYGKSGIGKSSIINAGVFPIARRNGMLPVGIRLDHSAATSYIDQIKKSIVKSGVDVHEILPAISEESETLWEYMHRCVFFDTEGNRKQLLIVLDQFEEIFTLQQDEKKKRFFFDDIASLLNDVTPLYIVNSNKTNKINQNLIESSESLENLDIDFDLEGVISATSSKYLQNVEYHIVFIIRDDFLSYLERYTKYIPLMKANRYALLPINEEQAKDIIIKPVKGLVEDDVAKLIIEKVTGRTDFIFGDSPEIEVDAAVLSLYLSRLYIKKNNAPQISAELVNLFSKDIIKDFYNESISDLPVAEVETIEDQLITYDGRRNNVSKNDLIKEGVSINVIKTLVGERKLLRQFSYQDDIRVEFMHDILCPIVNERIEHREQLEKEREAQKKKEEEDARKEKERLIQYEKLKKAEEEKQLLILKQKLQEKESLLIQKKQEEILIQQAKEKERLEAKARFFRITRNISATIVVMTLIALGYILYKYINKPTTIIKDIDVLFVFAPDETLEGDSWEAKVEIGLLQDSTYQARLLNQGKKMNNLRINGPAPDTIMIKMPIDNIDKPFDIAVFSKKEWLCDNLIIKDIKLEKPTVDSLQYVTYTIPLTRHKDAKYLFKGKITNISGSAIYNAFIVMGNYFVRSDNNGDFTITMKDSTELMGNTLNIFKKEYEVCEIQGTDILSNMSNQKEMFEVSLELRPEYDSLYYKELMLFDAIIKGNYDLTSDDSIFIRNYLGSFSRIGKFAVHSSQSKCDTTFTYIYKISNLKKDADKSRIFGYYQVKKNNQKKPFNGYLEEMEPVMNERETIRRWRMTINAYDSIFNNERIVGTLHNRMIDINM